MLSFSWGLRLQLLLLLAGLMLASTIPLFFATSTYTRLGLEQLQKENATKLGRSVAGHLSVLRGQTSQKDLLKLARAQLERDSVHALSILNRDGTPLAVLGEVELLKTVHSVSDYSTKAQVRGLRTPKGDAILVYEPGPYGGVAAVVRVDDEITRASALNRLMGLYMVVGGLALLVTTYFALTRWIVRPILALEGRADRIAGGGRKLEPLKGAPRELTNLSLRLAEMTTQLRTEEESLRTKIAELETRTEELRQAQASLVRSERLATVGRLAAGLAHEVGNPISALMGLQDLMITGELSDEENRDFLERMRKETARIHRVISDLLAYARPAGAQEKKSGEPGSVSLAIDGVFSLLGPQKDLKEMHLEKRVAAGLPSVALSQEELTQILLNLMMNAADACERKGALLVSAELAQGGEVEMVVQDDGPGIDPEIEGSLFEPFVSTKDVGKGTGLGLSVTKGLVEAAGGTISVSSPEGGGARFTILLPPLDDSN